MVTQTRTRVNSIIKVLAFWVLFIIILIAVTSQSGATLSKHVHESMQGIFGSFIALSIIWLFSKSEKKSLSDYGLRWEKEIFLKFLKGFAIGISSFVIVVFLFIVFAKIQIRQNPADWDPWTLYWYITIIQAVLMEELAFRSYAFLKLNNSLGLRTTQIIVAIVFAIYHLLFGWKIQVAFLGPGVWSFVFGIAAKRSGGIAVPIGIHFGLNLVHAMIGIGKSHAAPVWVVSEGEHIPIVSLTIQILILTIGIILTEVYIRAQKNPK